MIRCTKKTCENEAGRKILEAWGIDPDNWEGVANLVLVYADGEMPNACERKAHRVIIVE